MTLDDLRRLAAFPPAGISAEDVAYLRGLVRGLIALESACCADLDLPTSDAVLENAERILDAKIEHYNKTKGRLWRTNNSQ